MNLSSHPLLYPASMQSLFLYMAIFFKKPLWEEKINHRWILQFIHEQIRVLRSTTPDFMVKSFEHGANIQVSGFMRVIPVRRNRKFRAWYQALPFDSSLSMPFLKVWTCVSIWSTWLSNSRVGGRAPRRIVFGWELEIVIQSTHLEDKWFWPVSWINPRLLFNWVSQYELNQALRFFISLCYRCQKWRKVFCISAKRYFIEFWKKSNYLNALLTASFAP